ncbi:MAG: class I SAM-dependent methyltransferase [Dehalococcoidia bacterium]|nr:class I SAM-dependent methyltransferase [Dehalococcoidia bacterium]
MGDDGPGYLGTPCGAHRHVSAPRRNACNGSQADITRWTPEGEYDIWHDRAVFHFLVDEASRRAYLEALGRGLRPGGRAIISTFGPNGPAECSGLPVSRYDGASLQAAIGDMVELREERGGGRTTTVDAMQAFRYFVLRKAR